MEYLVKHFAKRVVLLHVLLLAILLVLVSFAMAEVYDRSREQAIHQTEARHALLASQTANGIEQYYKSIFADLSLLKRAEEDESLAAMRSAQMPAMFPGAAQRFAGRRPPLMFGRTLWKQLDGRVSFLFAVLKDDPTVARFFPEESRNRAERPGAEMGPVVPPPTTNPARQQQLQELQQIVDPSREWLKTVTQSTIGPFLHTAGGESNLIAIPVGGDYLAVAVVPVDTVRREFLNPLNARRGVGVWLIDDQMNVMAAYRPGLRGEQGPHMTQPQMQALAARLFAGQSAGSRVVEQDTVVDGVHLHPSVVNVQPFDVGGRRWWVVIGSSLEDTNAVVEATFHRAFLWSIFVVLSVTAILVSTAVQMIRQRVRLERVHHELLTKEIREARQIQLAWLPKSDDQPAGLSVAAVNQPATDISGDFYNWFELPDGRTAVVVGDVSGHGMSAAFLMATTQLLVRTTLQRLGDPGKCLEEVNRHLASQGPSTQFVTMLVLVFDPENQLVDVASAGHYPPLISRQGGHIQPTPARHPTGESTSAESATPRTPWQGGSFEPLPIDSQLVLGLDPDEPYPTHRVRLPANATLLLYTDGVLDCQASNGERFGLAGLRRTLPPDHASSAATIDAVVAALTHFRGACELSDDATLVAIQLHPNTRPTAPAAPASIVATRSS